jgi:hypothetical protein
LKQSSSAGRCRRRRIGELQAVHLDGSGDVLDVLRSQLLERVAELVDDLVAHDPADEDTARVGQRLQARGDVDAVAEDVVAVDDDVADVDADAKRDPIVDRNIRIAFRHAALDVDRAHDGIDHAWEFEQQAVAGRLDDPAAVFGDPGVDQRPQMQLERRQRPALVATHQAGEADDIGRDNRRQPSQIAHQRCL